MTALDTQDIPVRYEPWRAGRHAVVGLAALILVGAFVLSLPGISRQAVIGQKPYQWRSHVVNCLFTATAAATCTGLSVYDIGQDFTPAGQGVILALVQAGALVLMLLGAFVGVEVAALIGGYRVSRRRGPIVRFVLLYVIVAEALGFLLLQYSGVPADVGSTPRWFWNLFHAASAFCNSGLSLSPSGFVPYRGEWPTYGAILPLVVLGGLGSATAFELWAGAWDRLRSVRPESRGGSLSVYSRLVFLAMVGLAVAGAILLWLAETPTRLTKQYEVRMDGRIAVTAAPDQMSALPPGERMAAALFQSVAARSTGFRVVHTDEFSLSPASHVVLMVLMFCGGGFGSAAGGIGTIAVTVLLFCVASAWFGPYENPNLQRIAYGVAFRCFATLALSLAALIVAVALLLCYFEGGAFLSLLFESVSACCNAGLGTGVTTSLTRVGKALLVGGMFAGRVLPLLLVGAFLRRDMAGPCEWNVGGGITPR